MVGLFTELRGRLTALPKWLRAVPEIVHVEPDTEGSSRMAELQIEQ